MLSSENQTNFAFWRTNLTLSSEDLSNFIDKGLLNLNLLSENRLILS